MTPQTLHPLQRYAITASNNETLTGFVKYYASNNGYIYYMIYENIKSHIAIANVRHWFAKPHDFVGNLPFIGLIGVIGNPILIKPVGEPLTHETLEDAIPA